MGTFPVSWWRMIETDVSLGRQKDGDTDGPRRGPGSHCSESLGFGVSCQISCWLMVCWSTWAHVPPSTLGLASLWGSVLWLSQCYRSGGPAHRWEDWMKPMNCPVLRIVGSGRSRFICPWCITEHCFINLPTAYYRRLKITYYQFIHSLPLFRVI